MVRLGHRFPPAGRGGRQQQLQPQPAAAASSTGLRDTREGGERGARGRSSVGEGPGERSVPLGKAARLPRNHGAGAVVLAAAAAARGRCRCCQGHAHVTLGWRRALVRLRRARGGRAARSRARRARPHSPGGVAGLGGCWGSGGTRGQMHDRRSQSKARSASIWGGSLRCLQWLFGGGAKG